MSKPAQQSAGPWSDIVPVALVLILGVAISAALFGFVRGHYRTVERQHFQRDAAYYGALINGAVERHISALKSLRAFVVASGDVNRWEFSKFAEQTLPFNPGFRAVLWVPAISHDSRTSYEERLQRDGLYGLRIRERDAKGALSIAKKRPSYRPVTYVDPLNGNQDLIGLDLAVDPLYRTLLQTAERSDDVAASNPFEDPIAGKEAGASILLAFPLHAQDATKASGGVTREIKGYALGVLRIDHLIASVMPKNAPVEIAVVHETMQRPLYTSIKADGAVDLESLQAHASFFQYEKLTIAGQQLALFIRALEDKNASLQLIAPIGTALAALMLAALLAQHLYNATVYKRRVERAVVQRTADLERANEALRGEIDQRRAVEHDLRLAKESAELANRAKSHFLATMSHELRTPLNAIIGFSELMLHEANGGKENKRVTGYAQDISVSGLRLLHLINELLDLSHLDAERVPLDEDFVSVSEVIDTAVKRVAEQATTAKVALSRDIGSEVLIKADERLVTKAIVNLLSNAIKFTPAGGKAQISVRANGDGSIVITIKDTGIGIPASEQKRILEPFAQLQSVLTRTQDGMGIGLAFVNRIAQLHNFGLSIESKEGVGTSVTLTCPRERVNAKTKAA